MGLAAALIYWVIIAIWLAVLATVGIAYARNRQTFGAVRLLLAVLAIDTARNIVENLYFGLYFGGQYGLFRSAFVDLLGSPYYLILPKLMNVVAATAVLCLLALRWLPAAARERAAAESELRRTATALSAESEERRRLFETSLDLIQIIDSKGTFVRISPSSKKILGYHPQEVIGRSVAEFMFPDDLDGMRDQMRQARHGRSTRNFETRYVHKDGRIVPLVWSGLWSEPERRHFVIGRDMTEQKIAAERLRHLALYDQVTGLPNRVSLYEDLEALLEDAAAEAFAVVVFDLDGFKEINDTLGQTIGDQLLRLVADRVAANAAGGHVYRMGGDDFVVVFGRCGDPTIVGRKVNSVLASLDEQFEVDDLRLFVGANAGVAINSLDVIGVDALVANANLALRDAKEAGAQTYRLYAPTLRAKAEARRKLGEGVRRAHENNEFDLHFQPQVSSVECSIVGAEALLRWRHPDRGILPPGVFIDALAESAVAADAGRWILFTACKAAAQWRAAGLGKLKIAVNLFPAQFQGGTLVADVEAALLESGLPIDALELEVTENIALDQDPVVLSRLKKLRAKGVGIAFDDFGTGYASLSYLTRYPLTRIKIDRSFVRKITEQSSDEDTAIVRSIIAMAKNLGLAVTAEGVETVAQSSFLKAAGCDELQGFLFSKPLPAVKFERYLKSDWSHILDEHNDRARPLAG